MIQIIKGEPFPCRDCRKTITLKDGVVYDAMPTGNGEYILGKLHKETCPVKLMKLAMERCLCCFLESGENIIHAERHFRGHDFILCQRHKSLGKFKYAGVYHQATVESLKALLKEAKHQVNIEKKRVKIANGNSSMERFS